MLLLYVMQKRSLRNLCCMAVKMRIYKCLWVVFMWLDSLPGSSVITVQLLGLSLEGQTLFLILLCNSRGVQDFIIKSKTPLHSTAVAVSSGGSVSRADLGGIYACPSKVLPRGAGVTA